MVQKAADVSNILQHLDHCMEYVLPLVLDMETALGDYFGVDGGEANYPTILPLEYKCFEAASIPPSGDALYLPLVLQEFFIYKVYCNRTLQGNITKSSGYVAERNKSPTLKNLPMAAVHSKGSVIAC